MSKAAERRGLMTTGAVAKLAGCAPRTVTKWYDSGKLPGYRLPGSLDRRFRKADVVEFLKAHGVPCEGLAGESYRVLCVSDIHRTESSAMKTVFEKLERAPGEGIEVQLAWTLFTAGVQYQQWKPDALVVDLDVGRENAMLTVDFVRGRPVYAVALAYEDELDQAGLLRRGFHKVIQRPFDLSQLAACLAERAEAKRRGK